MLVDLCSFFVVCGIYANRFWMILDIEIQPFWNRVRFSIPYPPERPNAKHQVSNFGICQDLPESARSLPGSARNLPRISWSTIASTHLPHKHPPRNANQVTNRKDPKRGGGGDRPLAAFNESARGRRHRACLRALWVPCLHLPFCMCLLHSTFCTPPCSLTSVGFLLCFLPKESFEMIAFGDYAHSAGPRFFPGSPPFFRTFFRIDFWSDF